MGCEGKEQEYSLRMPQWQEQIAKQLSGLLGQQIGKPATPMPPELMGQMGQAYGVDPSMYAAGNLLYGMAGMGTPRTGEQIPMPDTSWYPPMGERFYSGDTGRWDDWRDEYEDRPGRRGKRRREDPEPPIGGMGLAGYIDPYAWRG